jgi:3-dehydroquinate synthase
MTDYCLALQPREFELENSRPREQTKLIMSLIERTIQISFRQRVYFTRHVFAPDNPLLADVLLDERSKQLPKILIVVDESLHMAQPDLAAKIESYFSSHAHSLQLVCPAIVLEGGERVKNSYFHVSEIQSYIDRYHMDRHSYVIAVGGGALLDVVGLAAATAHRGMRHVRIPTTTLSQDDSGIGVKNGINAFGKKNFIGTFAVPFAVINDFEMLSSLPPRDKRAGFIEAIKVSLIRDASFFDTIERDALKLRDFDAEAMERLIHRCAELHINHIATAGDPFELGSARPLDFGHWSAHKLEQLSDYRIRHGEAVAVGIALDVVYCRRGGFLDAHDANRIISLIDTLGFDLFANELLNVDSAGDLVILKGLEEFREHLGGELTITLLRAIGKGFEVHQMNDAIVVESIQELQERHARKGLKPLRDKSAVPSTL